MTSVWFKWRSATRRKQKSWYSLSPSLPSLSPSLSPRSPPAGTTSIQLKYVTITEWQLDTQWPVRTFISQCFILVRSQTAEKISKLFQGLEGDQTFLACPLTRPLIYNGLVRARLDSVCLKTYRGSSIAPQHTTIFPMESTPLFPGPTNTGKSTDPCTLAGEPGVCKIAHQYSSCSYVSLAKEVGGGGRGERGPPSKMGSTTSFSLYLSLPNQKLPFFPGKNMPHDCYHWWVSFLTLFKWKQLYKKKIWIRPKVQVFKICSRYYDFC